MGRQFLPELKVTTLKTFLEICPPSLIQEYRVADNLLRIKAIGGKISNIYFRQLEEPDKFRSMNLSGFMIDEANQVSEEAFLLLQGRLRGGGIRKGIVVSNPNGHDWLYRWFFQKDHLQNEWAKSQYCLVRAPSTENVHLPEGYLETMQQSWSKDRIAREIEGSFDAFEGMVYEEFRRDTHVIQPFVIPPEWPRFVGIDHGLRNPAAWVWCAVGKDGELYVYREFYQKEWLIHEIIQGKKENGVYTKGTMAMMNWHNDAKEKVQRAYIDPSVKNRKGSNGLSDWDEYYDKLPKDFPLYPANNDVTVGIDRVKSYMKIHPKLGRPQIYIFDTCKNLIEEITQYRYQELKPGQEGFKPLDERPVKVADHALDALRYVVVTLPDPYQSEKDKFEHLRNKTPVERALMGELEGFRTKKVKDPFGSGF